MEDIQIILSALWVAMMFTSLLGDVLRICSGDFNRESPTVQQITKKMWLGIAIGMVIPIFMIFLSLVLNYPINRWLNIFVAALFFVFNLIGLRAYPSAYDKFLIIAGLVFNGLTIWYACNWIS